MNHSSVTDLHDTVSTSGTSTNSDEPEVVQLRARVAELEHEVRNLQLRLMWARTD